MRALADSILVVGCKLEEGCMQVVVAVEGQIPQSLAGNWGMLPGACEWHWIESRCRHGRRGRGPCAEGVSGHECRREARGGKSHWPGLRPALNVVLLDRRQLAKRDNTNELQPPLGWRCESPAVSRAIRGLIAHEGRRQLRHLHSSHDETCGLGLSCATEPHAPGSTDNTGQPCSSLASLGSEF